MSSKATKGLSLPTSPPWGFPPPCQELGALLNSRTLCNIQKMYSEPLRPLTSHSGELKGLTSLCRLRPCWTKAGKAAHSQGGTGVSGWRPFAGSCFGSSVLPEAPGVGHLDCAAHGLRRKNARGPGTASSIERKPAWCEDHVLLIWPCTTLVCSFFFFREKGFPLWRHGTAPTPPPPNLPSFVPHPQPCW